MNSGAEYRDTAEHNRQRERSLVINRFFNALTYSAASLEYDGNELSGPAIHRLEDVLKTCNSGMDWKRNMANILLRISPEVTGRIARSLNLHERVAMGVCQALVSHDTTRLGTAEKAACIARTMDFLVEYQTEDCPTPEAQERARDELGAYLADGIVRVTDAAAGNPTPQRVSHAQSTVSACIGAGLISEETALKYIDLPDLPHQRDDT